MFKDIHRAIAHNILTSRDPRGTYYRGVLSFFGFLATAGMVEVWIVMSVAQLGFLRALIIAIVWSLFESIVATIWKRASRLLTDAKAISPEEHRIYAKSWWQIQSMWITLMYVLFFIATGRAVALIIAVFHIVMVIWNPLGKKN